MNELQRFQSEHRDHLGRPLKADGDAGPLTQWAQDVVALGARGRIVTEALLHVGLREVKPNEHPSIALWLARCGVTVPAPWCAAFASAMASHSGVNLHEASVRRLVEKLPQTLTPRPGDFGCWVDADGKGHVWIWTCLNYATGEGLTVEGNTDDGVRVWRRRIADFISLQVVPEATGPLWPAPEMLPPLKVRGGRTR